MLQLLRQNSDLLNPNMDETEQNIDQSFVGAKVDISILVLDEVYTLLISR